MNRQIQQNNEKRSIYVSMLARRDLASAEIVEKGIALQALCGTKSAAQFLRSKMIAMDVVIRVLSRRSERRNDASRKNGDSLTAARALWQKKNNECHLPKVIALAPGWRH